MEIPAIWLWVSGIFFTVAIIAQGAMVVLLTRLISVVKDVQPQIKSVSERVESVSKKVDEMSTTLKATVENVSQKTSSVADTAQLLALETGKKAGPISNVLFALTTAIKVYRTIQDLRGIDKKRSPEVDS